jgi:O-antigen/teichoic acid export membrane protein
MLGYQLNIRNKFATLIRIAKNHGGYFLTTIINSALPLLFLPLLTRYLEPAEYANIALFNFYLMLSNSLSGDSIPVVISKNFFDLPKNHIAKIIGNSIRIAFLFSLFTSAVFITLYFLSESILNLPLFWILLIPWGSFFYIILNIALTVNRNERKVLIFSYLKIGNTVTNIIISVFLIVVLIWGWQGRVTGILISYFLSAIWSLYYLVRKKYLDLKFNPQIIKNILKVVIPLIPNSFQYIIISHVGLFFMNLYFSKSQVGIYSIAYQISFSISLLYTTISFSWSPYVYEQLSKPLIRNNTRFTKLYYVISGILLLGVGFVSVFSGLMIRIFTTEKYFNAREFIPVLALGFFFKGLYIFLLPVLIKNEKQKAVSVISFVNMCLMIGLNVVFIKLYGPIGVAYAFCATCFFLFLPVLILVQKVFPLPWLRVFRL